MRLLQNKFENKGVLLLKIPIFALHSLNYKGKGKGYEQQDLSHRHSEFRKDS